MNKLKDEINKIPFNNFVRHHPKLKLDIFGKPNMTFVDIGGGGTAKDILLWISDNGGHLTTIDLCTEPRTDMKINEKSVGDSGAGDYSGKMDLYPLLLKNPEISKVFNYYNMDAYEYFNKHHKGDIDFYYDDGTHHSDYLIPLFTKVMTFCKSGAVMGSHDKNEPEMKEFINWIKNHERVAEVHNDDPQSIFVVLK